MDANQALWPPVDIPEIQRGMWHPLPADDPVANYWSEQQQIPNDQVVLWQTARLAHTVYVYQEAVSGFAVAAKFYMLKTPHDPQRYARQELGVTERAYNLLNGESRFRVPQALGAWRGVLFSEYIDGLTLEDTIAVRRSRPGTLQPALNGAAELLAELHQSSVAMETEPRFEDAAAYAYKLIGELSEHGVLRDDPLARQGLERMVERWAVFPPMNEFAPCRTHGDATTGNFIYPWEGASTAAIDWERSWIEDPAADLGRLMAEAAHSIQRHGGSSAEAQPYAERMCQAYLRALPPTWDGEALLLRAHFYQASSILRIARNGWVPRQDRLLLINQAFSLLSEL